MNTTIKILETSNDVTELKNLLEKVNDFYVMIYISSSYITQIEVCNKLYITYDTKFAHKLIDRITGMKIYSSKNYISSIPVQKMDFMPHLETLRRHLIVDSTED